MNQLMLLIFSLVGFVYFGGKYVPPVLRQYKELLLGVAIGCLICCATGMEGMDNMEMKGMKGMKGMKDMKDMKGMKGVKGMKV